MQNYKSTKEKAAQWNITARHVQYLCRTGKITGAVKRAGSWLIPDETPVPVKNTKSNTGGFNFFGTKSKIFDSAIELFVSKGFSNVSFQLIANDVGIKQSTIYNHFKSKQEILETIYDFYCYYYLKERPSLKTMEALLKNESVLKIIEEIRYDFAQEYKQKLYDITKIIFQRMAIDDRAREIAKSLMIDEGIKYVEDVFNIGIRLGRFAPFDVRAAAIFINAVRMFTLYNWIIDPSPAGMARLLEDEQKQYEIAAGIIPLTSAKGNS